MVVNKVFSFMNLDIRVSFVVKYLMLSTLKKLGRALYLIIKAVCGKSFNRASAKCSYPPDQTKDKTRQYPNPPGFDKNKINRF
jgi:hypothetical protein